MTFSALSKAPSGYRAFSTMAPWQQGLAQGQAQGLGQLNPQIFSYLQNILSGDPEAMKAFEAPYMRQFNEQIVPGLAQQFAGMGALSSSGFQQALGQAGAGLSENLAALREGLRSKAAGQGMDWIQNLLNMNTQGLVPKKKPFWQEMLGSAASGAGQAIGMLPMLAML